MYCINFGPTTELGPNLRMWGKMLSMCAFLVVS